MEPSSPSRAQRGRRAARPPAALVVLTFLAGICALVGAGGTSAQGTSEPPPPIAERAVTISRTQPRHVAVTPPLPVRTVNGTTYRPRRTAAGTAAKVIRPPKVRARAWVVADLDSGRILATHQHRRPLPQASTIKLLTAVTASGTVAPRPRHRVTWSEAHPEYCSCAGLVVGARYTREALMAGMLLPSGNDAAEALAGSHPQGRKAFLAAMNARADALGASDTQVVTPSGLTAPGAHSSARDLVLFIRAAQADPVVAPLLDRAKYWFGPRASTKRTIYRTTDYVNRYVGINPGTRGKSGFTTPAGNTLVVNTPVRGRNITVATLGSPGGWSSKGARSLTMWANASFSRLDAVAVLPSGG